MPGQPEEGLPQQPFPEHFAVPELADAPHGTPAFAAADPSGEVAGPQEAATAEADLNARQGKASGWLGRLARRTWEATRTFATDASEVWASARTEIAGTGVIKNAGRLSLLGANVIGIGAEQFVINEAVLGSVLGYVLANDESLLTGVPAAAVTTGGTAFLIQAGLGIATALSLKLFPHTMATIRSKLNKNSLPATDKAPAEGEQAPETEVDLPKRSVKTRFDNAFVLGTSLVTIGRNAKHELSTAQNLRDILGDAALVGSGVTVIGGIIAIAVNGLRGTRAEILGDIAVTALTFPPTYIGYFILSKYLKARKKRKLQAAVIDDI